MAIGRAKDKQKFKPITSVRRSQLITTYGIGSLIPIASESFIMLGQNYWFHSKAQEERNEIVEPGLAKALGVRTFLQPPSGEHSPLRLARFPEWASCPNCNRLSRWSQLARKVNDEWLNECRHCPGKSLVTSRFVAACSNGHIQDFPYWRWVHQNQSNEDNGRQHDLRLTVDGTDDSLRGIKIVCSCGAQRSMENALGRGALRIRCEGKTPWLPQLADAQCGQWLVGLQRGASGVWRSEVRSAISISAPETEAEIWIRENYDRLSRMPETLRRGTLEFQAGELSVPVTDLVKVFNSHKVDPNAEPNETLMQEIRDKEYRAFQASAPEIDGDEQFICEVERVEPRLRDELGLFSIASLPRLREVRALTGFSRIDSGDEESDRNESLLSEMRMDWLPAIEAFGEGVFVQLCPDRIHRWETSQFAVTRAHRINDAAPITGSTPRYLLLHSLSHALMNQLALTTGYPASSIRERIYARGEQAGILLYTSTSDSAGSLGGLSAQGTVDNLSKILTRAVEHARWCTADPVCIESNVRGVDSTNLAACHYCMLAPEVSCESKNQFLDRACLVGVPEESEGGYFNLS